MELGVFQSVSEEYEILFAYMQGFNTFAQN